MRLKDVLKDSVVQILEQQEATVEGRYLYHVTLKNPYYSGLVDKGIRPRHARFESTPKVFLLPSKANTRALANELFDWRTVGKGFKHAEKLRHEEPTYWVITIDVDRLLPNTKVFHDSASVAYKGLYVTKVVPSQAIVNVTPHNY